MSTLPSRGVHLSCFDIQSFPMPDFIVQEAQFTATVMLQPQNSIHLAFRLSYRESLSLDHSLSHLLLQHLLCETTKRDRPSAPSTNQRAHNTADRCCPLLDHTPLCVDAEKCLISFTYFILMARHFFLDKVTNYNIIGMFYTVHFELVC